MVYDIFLFFFRLYPYLVFLFLVGHFLSVLITIGPSLSQNKFSPFKAHGGIFMIMTIVSLSLVVLASGVMIFTSHYLQHWMNDLHFTILKSIGCFSTINALFSLGAVFFVPENLNWIVYLVMSLIFVCILVTYYFLWKYVCTHQQNKLCNTFPFHWTVFLIVLFPLSIALWPFIPPNLYTTWHLVTYASFIMVVVAGYFSFTELENPKYATWNRMKWFNKTMSEPSVWLGVLQYLVFIEFFLPESYVRRAIFGLYGTFLSNYPFGGLNLYLFILLFLIWSVLHSKLYMKTSLYTREFTKFLKKLFIKKNNERYNFH